jgi:hypothetical protein
LPSTSRGAPATANVNSTHTTGLVLLYQLRTRGRVRRSTTQRELPHLVTKGSSSTHALLYVRAVKRSTVFLSSSVRDVAQL